MSYVGESMHEISVANGWYVTRNTLLKFVVSLVQGRFFLSHQWRKRTPKIRPSLTAEIKEQIFSTFMPRVGIESQKESFFGEGRANKEWIHVVV